MSVKVFGIGLGKTGTHSLNQALIELGFNARHYPPPGIMIQKRFKDLLSRYDALTDSPVVPVYKDLDQQFPGSKFIFTIRAADGWIESYEDHYSKSKYVRMRGQYKRLRLILYGTNEFDREKMLAKYHQHYKDVMDYFKNRDGDLLIMDIIEGDGWDKLCPFLDKNKPNIPFPHMGARKDRKEKK